MNPAECDDKDYSTGCLQLRPDGQAVSTWMSNAALGSSRD